MGQVTAAPVGHKIWAPLNALFAVARRSSTDPLRSSMTLSSMGALLVGDFICDHVQFVRTNSTILRCNVLIFD